MGAGATGSLLANLLSKRGGVVAGTLPLELVLWDKASGGGGRMSTHRLATGQDPPPKQGSGLHVDMGAQYISRFRDEAFHDKEVKQLKENVFQELTEKGVLVEFSGEIEGFPPKQDQSVVKNYVAPAGLSHVAKHLLNTSNAEVFFKHCLVRVDIDQRERKVNCTCTAGGNGDGLKCCSFDALVLTMPVPQVLGLEGGLVPPHLESHLKEVQYSLRYALGLFFEDATDWTWSCSWTAKYFDDPVVRFMCWDTAKYASPAKGRTLLVHTSVPFGLQFLETDKKQVEQSILEVVKRLLPDLPKPCHTHIIRWRFSQVFKPYKGTPGFVVLNENPLVVVTGDAFVHSNFEGCIEAALAVANNLFPVIN